MAIGTPTGVGRQSITTDDTSATFDALVPSSGVPTWILIHTVVSEATAIEPVVTGTGGWNVAWTNVGEYEAAAIGIAHDRVTLFFGVPSSSTSGQITATTTGQTQNLFGLEVYTITGTDVDSVVAANTKTGTGTGTAMSTAAMSSWGAGNIAIGCVTIAVASPTLTWEDGWTVIDSEFYGSSPTRYFSTAYATTEDTTPTCASGTSGQWIMVAFEIQEAASGGTTESMTATSAGTSTDTAELTLNIAGTATSAGTSLDSGAITTGSGGGDSGGSDSGYKSISKGYAFIRGAISYVRGYGKSTGANTDPTPDDTLPDKYR